MLRACLIALLLLPVLNAQTPRTAKPTEKVPIEFTAKISPVDPQKWVGFPEGPGLFMTVENVSGRGVQGYVYETVFTDPASGQRVEHLTHSTNKPPSLGVLLEPGAKTDAPKPYHVPIAPSGLQASYSFVVDFVVFEDGSTWGTDMTQDAKKLARIRAALKRQ